MSFSFISILIMIWGPIVDEAIDTGERLLGNRIFTLFTLGERLLGNRIFTLFT